MEDDLEETSSFIVLIKVLLASAILLSCAQLSLGHSDGAPASRCDSMVPGHWVTAQTTPCPYRIFVNKDSIQEGEGLSINLTTAQGHPGFKGFLVMVKKPGDEFKNFGIFNTEKSDMSLSQPLDCFERELSAMTHMNSEPKRFVHLEWFLPKLDSKGDQLFEIRATFVQNFWTIWTEQTPGKLIRVTKIEQDVHNDSASTPSSTLAPSSARTILVPQVRGVDAGIGRPNAESGSESKFSNSTKDPNSYTKMEGSWEHFKKTWMNLLHYFGF